MASQIPTLALWTPGPLELVILSVFGLMALAGLAGIVTLIYLAIRHSYYSRHHHD